MPGAALAATSSADAVLPLEDIAPFIHGLLVKPARATS
jgi:hypothetical protein